MFHQGSETQKFPKRNTADFWKNPVYRNPITLNRVLSTSCALGMTQEA